MAVDEPMGGVQVARDHRADVTARHRGVKLAARRAGRYVAPRSATGSLIPLLFPTLIAGASQSGGIASLSVPRAARRGQDAVEITRREDLPLRPPGSNHRRCEGLR